MAFWKKKSEDPWDIDPNRKREPALFYERDLEPQPAPAPLAKEAGLASSERTAEQKRPAFQEESE